jgi:glyoxylase-like metal-dependent hydrolase (beta-lactamase superfamily II)
MTGPAIARLPRIRLHVLDLGRLRMDRALLVANWRLASVADPAPPAEFVEIPVSAYVLEHSDGRILFDTGCHPDAMGEAGLWPRYFQEHFPWSGDEACQLPNRLAALGLGPDDFSAVVLSHLHNDHAGCVELFRHSRLIAHADEMAAALHDRTGNYVAAETDRWRRLDLHWHLLERDAGDLDLCEAATVLNWGSGHAPGMLGLLVRLPDRGNIILASDAVYGAANFTPSFRRPGVLHDSLGYDATVRRIFDLAQRTGATVWFGHDLEQFAKLRHSTEGCYE